MTLQREKLCRDSLHVLSEREEFCLQWAELSVADGASRETRFQPQASSSCRVEACSSASEAWGLISPEMLHIYISNHSKWNKICTLSPSQA